MQWNKYRRQKLVAALLTSGMAGQSFDPHIGSFGLTINPLPG
jgi:hypothetical protein